MQSLKKLSVAAVFVIGVTAFLVLNRTPGSIALADVYTRVQQARTFMYTISMTMTGMGEMMGQPDSGATAAEGVVLISTEHGMKMENRIQTRLPDGTVEAVTQLAYMLPNDNIIVSIMPEQKFYQKIELTEQLLAETQKQNNDPREMIRQMMDCDYVSLGQAEINGVKVQGFETTDPAYSAGIGGDVRAVLWVATDTWLPVQSEVFMTMGKMNIHIVISDVQWDIPVDAAEFAYVIPEDYQEFGSFKMPDTNEEAAVEGLRVFAEFFGKYPESLDLASLVSSLMEGLKEMVDNPTTEYAKEFARKIKSVEAESGQQAAMQQVQQVMMPITSLGMFYANLSQSKYDPAYYGAQFTVQDTDAVLLRWKTDSGTYKVIFGDLSVAEMSYDALRAIEPADRPQPKQISGSSLGVGDPASQAAHTGARLTRFGQTATNIKRMLLACVMHWDKNGDWPDTLEALVGQGIDQELLVNPARPELANGYIYIKPVLPDDMQHSPDKKIVIYEAYETWGEGIYVGFADGHVEFVRDEADFQKLLTQ